MLGNKKIEAIGMEVIRDEEFWDLKVLALVDVEYSMHKLNPSPGD